MKITSVKHKLISRSTTNEISELEGEVSCFLILTGGTPNDSLVIPANVRLIE